MKGHKVGDEVYVDSFSSYQSFGADGCGRETITDVRRKYDPDNGQPYPQYLVDGFWYDGRDGSAVTGPTAYYLEDIDQPKRILK